MKNFRKTDSDQFICEECRKTFKLCTSLSTHVGKYHNKKEYYDKWIKEEGEEICPTCGNKNIYLNRWDRGYSKYCSKTCKKVSEETKKKIKASLKETCLEKYGTDNFMSTALFKEKRKITWLQNYGVNNPLESDVIRQKIKETNIKKYGVDNASKAECTKNKTKETCVKKYGGPAPALSKKS